MYSTRTTTFTFQVSYRCLTSSSTFRKGCAALTRQRYSLCPHCADSFRLTSASTATVEQHPQPQLYVNLLCGTHRTQWGKQCWNTTSTQYLPYSKSIITTTSTIWHGSLFYLRWGTVATISLWGTEILQGHANRHLAYPPQADVDTLLSIYQQLFTSTAHATCRVLRSHHSGHNTLMMRAGVRWVVVEATPPSPLDAPAITQPQGSTEEFSDTRSPTRGQMPPHTGGSKQRVSFSDAHTARRWIPVLNTTRQHSELNIHGHTQPKPLRAHIIVTQIFQTTYCPPLDAPFTLQVAK